MTERGTNLTQLERREAMLLSWKSYRFPFGTLFTSSLVLVVVLSAVFTVMAQGPVNPIP